MTLDEAIQWAFAESEYHDSIADSLQAEIDLYKVPKKVHMDVRDEHRAKAVATAEIAVFLRQLREMRR